MDAFRRIANVFKEDCEMRLKALESASLILETSDSVATALRLMFVTSTIYPGDYEQILSIPSDMERLRNCIDSTEVKTFFLSILISVHPLTTTPPQETIEHARRLFIINFNVSDKFLVFNQEICYSYACKMLNSMGPRLVHFSNSPTHTEVVDAELFLALNSPYTFTDEDLFCYEGMPDIAGKSCIS